MAIITLTTDLGYRDPYLAIVKARLLSVAPSATVIDLSCDIRDNNVAHAAYILKGALPHFPEGTIHLVAVKFLMDKSRNPLNQNIDNSRFLVANYQNQYIICPDNGLFTLIDAGFNSTVFQLYYEGGNKQHFFLKDVFAPAALHLLAGKPMDDIAGPVDDFYKAYQFESYVSGNMLRGKGIYVDDFGNIVTNITRQNFEDAVGKRSFLITLPGARINKIHTTYDEVKYGTPLVLFNTFGYLEVAVNGKSAFNMLCPRDIGATFDFNILIEFYD